MKWVSPNLKASMAKLAAAEEAFLGAQFLAPVLRGGAVHLRIAGVRCQMRVSPASYEGWGVFRPESYTDARLVRPSRMDERQEYLALMPKVTLVLFGREGRYYLGLSAEGGEKRFELSGTARLLLTEDADVFDTVHARYDGAQLWFDRVDSRTDPGAAAYLRQALREDCDPVELARPGLTAVQRQAYAIAYARQLENRLATQQDRDEYRLRSALAHAGAGLRDCHDRGNVYSVSYEVDGHRHTSIIRKEDLTVETAGICLSGQDRQFDLQSLVGVLRQGHEGGDLYWSD